MDLRNLLKRKVSRFLCRPVTHFDLNDVVLLGIKEDPRHLKRAVSSFGGVLFRGRVVCYHCVYQTSSKPVTMAFCRVT